MEVDHVPYIFGSFNRRRHSQNLSTSKKSGSDGAKPCHMHSHSQPHASDTGASRAKPYLQPKTPIDEDERFICGLCRTLYVEPRVLSCLHTFCTPCLQEIERKDLWDAVSEVSLSVKSESPASGGSGYDSGEYRPGYTPEPHHKMHSGPQTDEKSDYWISCPLCGSRTALNQKGILGLPSNFILQHRIVLATLNNENIRLLCDLCTSDVTAVYRCSECLINLCNSCTDGHKSHRLASDHEVLLLREVRQKGSMRIRRQIMCQFHPEQELIAFCASCTQVACKDCANTIHANHVCEPASRAALTRTGRIHHALQRARNVVEKDISLNQRLQITHSSVEGQCRRIEEEIEEFINDYREALEEHRKALLQQVSQIRNEKLLLLKNQQEDLNKRVKEGQNTVEFAEELLDEGTDVEILTFISTILKKLEFFNKVNTEEQMAPKMSESVHFLPNEIAEYPNGRVPVFGRVTTQTVAPNQCVLHKDGSEHLRIHRKSELILETRDSEGCQVTYGGDSVTAELWYRDAGTSCRSLDVQIQDKRDGTYAINFTPDTPGKLSLAVKIKGQHIKDSPFPIHVRNLRPHRGNFHCCNFCSSGGNKEATCACGGSMPGGYRGCGHGHEGHPGRRHWSCCGNILENSECGRVQSALYQITL